MTIVPGLYKWIYNKGSFEVELRRYKNVFYCAAFSVSGSTWEYNEESKTLIIQWKKYGDYEFHQVASEESGTISFDGHVSVKI